MHFLHAIHFDSRRMNLEMNREICQEKYVSTEMNWRQISVIVHPSANKLAWFKRSLNATCLFLLTEPLNNFPKVICVCKIVSNQRFTCIDCIRMSFISWRRAHPKEDLWMINKRLKNPQLLVHCYSPLKTEVHPYRVSFGPQFWSNSRVSLSCSEFMTLV